MNVPTLSPGDGDRGFDVHDFWSLAGRLVPCGPAHMLTAIDLRHRLWWWSDGDVLWDSVPVESYDQRLREIKAWRAIAPTAIDALVTALSGKKGNLEAESHLARFGTIQDTLMRTLGFACAWQGGWLYRSLLLDHRWLLRNFPLPQFDEYIFSILILEGLSGFTQNEAVSWFQRDPIIAAMPALHDIVFPESWKTGVILALKQRNIFATVEDVDRALERMAIAGRFNSTQAQGLKNHFGPLHGAAGRCTKSDVIAEVASARLDAAGGQDIYVPFSLPTADNALIVTSPLVTGNEE